MVSPEFASGLGNLSVNASGFRENDSESGMDEISFVEAVEPSREPLLGHHQVSDAYLLGLAMHKKGKLATMDRAVLALLPEGSSERGSVAVIARIEKLL